MAEECEKCAILEKIQNERWEAHRREHVLMDSAREAARSRVEDRLNDMNELREQINNERGKYLAVADFDREHKGLVDKVDGIYKFIYMAMGAIALITILAQGLFLLLRMRF